MEIDPSSPSLNVSIQSPQETSPTSPPKTSFGGNINTIVDYTDSPSYPLINVKCLIEPGISPMSELARNLCSTSLGLNPRKLSLSSITSEDASPLPPHYDKMVDSPMKMPTLMDHNSRLLKNALKVTNTTPVGVSRRGVARRLSQVNRDQDRDENLPPSLITSPNKSLTSPSKFAAFRQISRTRMPLEDHDPNSQDSGISEDSNKSGFRFAEPCGLAPRKLSTTEFSPRRLLATNSNSGSGLSQSSNESIDDGFMELIHQDKMLEDENAQLPSGMSSLLMQPIIRNENVKNSPRHDISPHRQITFRRCFSENISTKTTVEEFSLKMKRPANRPADSPQSKRARPLTENCNNTPQRKPAQRTLFDHGFMRKTVSPKNRTVATEASIKHALLRSTTEELIGDCSRPYALPLIKGLKNEDLKNITSETLADLIRGKYSSEIASYQIIDCRYPYEYEGGHIKSAKNIYTKDQLDKEYLETKPKWVSQYDKRNVLIFHCEFSSERGPSLSRFLRQRDRDNNRDTYPSLDYPEMYLLDGGYKAFYQNYPELCEPCAYLKMNDPKHEEDLKLFRSKAKSWAGDRKFGRFSKRPLYMRLT